MRKAKEDLGNIKSNFASLIMVEIFKTNVQQASEATELRQKLLEHFVSIKINFDLDDCDKILRVQGIDICNEKIITLLNASGYQCEVL